MDQEKQVKDETSETEGGYVKLEETVCIQILQSLEGIKRKLHSILKAK